MNRAERMQKVVEMLNYARMIQNDLPEVVASRETEPGTYGETGMIMALAISLSESKRLLDSSR